MSLQIEKYVLAVAMVGAIVSAPTWMFGQTQAPAAAKGPQWKDRMEYDLFVAITKDTNPKTKLEKLQQWEKAVSQNRLQHAAADLAADDVRRVEPA